MDTSIHRQIRQDIANGKNLLITGAAGVGKSTIIREVVKSAAPSVVITAMTGVAALNVSGQTLHKFTGIGIQTDKEYVDHLVFSHSWPLIRKVLRKTDVLVIDECSMLRSDVLELVDAVFKKATNIREPFGGKQVVMCGDFLQLPPVVRDYEDLDHPWAFQSKIWKRCEFEIYNLTEIYRQDDKKFINALHEIRQGNCPDWVDEMMQTREKAKLAGELKPTRFLATNNEVDVVNRKNLAKIPEEPHKFLARITGINDTFKQQIEQDCLAPRKLFLKRGAQVMAVKNDKDGQYVNGSMGKVTEFSDSGFPIVKIERTGKEIEFSEDVWERKGFDGTVLARFRQIPLKLAYAVTIHKSQGLTLDVAEIDFKGIFSAGQAYVALSRVRSLEGLRLRNWNRDCVSANQEALEFYRKGCRS